MRSLFTEFYCLPIRDILVLAAVATWLFLKLDRRFRHSRVWKAVLFAACAGFTAVIVYLTLQTREGNGQYGVFFVPFHSYRQVLSGGNPEILRSNFMNVVLFYPSGLLFSALLPEKWPRWVRWLPAVLLFGALSAGVEYLQFTRGMGLAEIDDVIHNTLGALLGALCSLIPLPPQPITTDSPGSR